MNPEELMQSKPVDVLIQINHELEMIKHDMHSTIFKQNREIIKLKETVNELIVKEERLYGNSNRTC